MILVGIGVALAWSPIGAQVPDTSLRAAARLELPPEPPEAHLGFRPGEDYEVADWGQVSGYLAALADRSHRVRLDTIGRSTLDRPMLLLTISHPENLDRLEEFKGIQARLADPRRIEGAAERATLIRDGRLIVLITAAIHPTEVGSVLAAMSIAYRLASATDPETMELLREAVILIVPSVNPDGVDLVADWYRSSIGMPWEGERPPFLYHHYAGHDNNRDWYAFTQLETLHTVEKVHNVWNPHIVHDIHQQEPLGSRFFVPPWMDPIEPNVDPLLIAASNSLGTAIAWDMQRSGLTGVTVNAGYDAWGPARAYPHYHAGVRILSETASARLASPVEIRSEELSRARGWRGADRAWNQPAPWPGGRWGLSDIVRYMEAGAMALLSRATENRRAWLENFVAVGEKAVAGWPRWPAAWVIPGGQTNEAGVAELVRILDVARVEMEVAGSALRVGAEVLPAGSIVIPMRQPYAAFVQAVLSPQTGSGSTTRPPYDATAHNLPLLLGVRVVRASEAPTGDLEPLRERPSAPRSHVPGVSGESGLFVGLYQPWVPSEDEGWTRWLFDRFEVPYATLRDHEIRQGDLEQRFTAIVIPSLNPDLLEKGWPAGTMPPEYTGGLGAAGFDALRDFARSGGTLVSLGEASGLLVERLGLPVTDRLRGQVPERFRAGGALVRLQVDTTTLLGRGMPPQTAGWIQHGNAFDLPGDSDALIAAVYGAEPRVLSGWVHGVSLLAGAAAVVEVPLGSGRVVLFGIRPQYRGQSRATFPLLFNALRLRPGI